MANENSPPDPFRHYGFIRLDVQLGPIHDQMVAFSIGVERSLFNEASVPIDWTDDPLIRLANRSDISVQDTRKKRELLCNLVVRDIERHLLKLLAKLDTRNGYPITKDTTNGTL